MKEKKNIDRLFQEKFKNFEAHPSDQVWKNIVNAKQKKKDRKIVPIWWRLAGVAAIALLLFTAGIAIWNNASDVNDTSPELVQLDQNKNNSTTTDIKSNNAVEPIQSKQTESGIAVENANSNELSSEDEPQKREKNALFGVSDTQGAIANQESPTARQQIENKEKSNQTYSDATTIIDTEQSTTTGVATTQEKQNNNTPQKRSDLINPNITIDNTIDDTAVAVTEETTDTSQNQDSEENLEEENKKSLVDEAARIAEANAEEEEDIQEKEAIARRWDVGAVAAPVYYGDFGGSGIDPQFKDNNKTSDLNLSYGVQVSYAVTPKFKVRTGVSNVDLNYNTQDISFTPSNSAQTLRGVDFSQNASFLEITDRVNPSTALASPTEDGFGQGGNTVSNGEIQQNVGYIEIPLEAIYVLSDKRLGVELIGGLSTLVLNNNEVFLESNGLRTSLGTSNALNDVSFTTNLGLGLNYKVTEKVKINIEPSLKYQLNAYNNNVGEFKPYYVGLYTGVNYRF